MVRILSFVLGTLVVLPFALVFFGGTLALISALLGLSGALAVGKAMCAIGGLGIAILFLTDFGQLLMTAPGAIPESKGDDSARADVAKGDKASGMRRSMLFGRLLKTAPSKIAIGIKEQAKRGNVD